MLVFQLSGFSQELVLNFGYLFSLFAAQPFYLLNLFYQLPLSQLFLMQSILSILLVVNDIDLVQLDIGLFLVNHLVQFAFHFSDCRDLAKLLLLKLSLFVFKFMPTIFLLLQKLVQLCRLPLVLGDHFLLLLIIISKKVSYLKFQLRKRLYYVRSEEFANRLRLMLS